MASMTTRQYRYHHDLHVPPPSISQVPTFGAPPVAAPLAGPGLTFDRMTTALAPPPPPLQLADHRTTPKEERRVRYAGAEHTLGPTFSDEEDGDDSAFIASQMAALGLSQPGAQYGSQAFERFLLADPLRASDRSRGPDVQAQAQARLQRQLQLQQLAQQQQQALLLQSLLSNQPRSNQQANQQHQQLRETLALLELQQVQQASTNPQLQAHIAAQAQAQRALLAAQMQQQQQQQHQMYLKQLRQQQLSLLSDTRQPYSSPSEQRNVLAAQVQASLLARTNRARGMHPDDADLRARFESAPNSNDAYKTPQEGPQPVFEQRPSPHSQPSSASSTPWRSAQPTLPAKTPAPDIRSPVGRFAQARQAMANDPKPLGSLSAVLTRRRMTDEESATSQSSATSERKTMETETVKTSPTTSFDEPVKTVAVKNLGVGRPLPAGSGVRSATSPAAATATASGHTNAPPRAASYTAGQARAVVVRQPLGPPGGAKELEEKNFQARIRRQAGLNLGMLGRRQDAPGSAAV